jgi:hypothetical protein
MDAVFLEFVKSSTLPEKDKEFWISILATLTEDQIKIFEDFTEGKEENLKTLTENIKAKEQAFRNSNENALEEIINSEK